MNIFARKWDEIALIILAVQAFAWLVAEIFLARFLGYPIVIVMLVAFFLHALVGFREIEED